MTVQYKFSHDPCGQDGQVMNVYFRLEDSVVLIEGVCIHCNEGYTKIYDVAETHRQFTPKLSAPRWTEEDRRYLKAMHITDEEAA